jgi:DNA polymerase-1
MEESFLHSITPVVKAIIDFKRLQKQDGMNLESYVNPVTGRIHPKYDQLGAATSRISSSSPNSQQIGNKSHATLTLNKLWFLPVKLKADWL